MLKTNVIHIYGTAVKMLDVIQSNTSIPSHISRLRNYLFSLSNGFYRRLN